MKINVFTLDVDNFEQEVIKITFPLIESYAKKIGANFVRITERKFPSFNRLYEIMQIHELGKDSDWNIFIDPTVIVREGMIDMTKECPSDTVGHWGVYGAESWYYKDDVFKKDERDIAFPDFMVCVPRACHDLWKPAELPYEVAIVYAGRDHWIAEWNLSRNLAINGYKEITFKSPERINGEQHDMSCYQYLGGGKPDSNKTSMIERANIYITWKKQ